MKNNDHLQTATLQYQAAKFDVMAMPVPANDGTQRTYHIVKPNDAVVLLPLLDEQHVVMIRNRRHGVGKVLWELPAGTLEAGEDPAECAGRELIEETGYRAATLEELTAFYTCPGFCTERLTAFVARNLSEAAQQLDDTEQIEPKVMTLTQAYDMLRDGEIEDAKTMAVLLYHRFMRDEG